jgi:PIN domain nuclease of toxin-antitoxin system
MKLLIDTHILIWAVDDPAKLTAKAASAVQEPANDLLVSAATVWELAIKIGLKKLSLSLPFHAWMTRVMHELDLSILPISVDYADRQSDLPHHHHDPFDRLLIAQALTDGTPIVSADAIKDAYGVARIW